MSSFRSNPRSHRRRRSDTGLRLTRHLLSNIFSRPSSLSVVGRLWVSLPATTMFRRLAPLGDDELDVVCWAIWRQVAQDRVWSRFALCRCYDVDACWPGVLLAVCRCFPLSAPHSLPTCLRKHVLACNRNSSAAHSGIRCRSDPTCVSHADMQSNGCVVLGLSRL